MEQGYLESILGCPPHTSACNQSTIYPLSSSAADIVFKLNRFPQLLSHLSNIWIEYANQYCPQTCGIRIFILFSMTIYLYVHIRFLAIFSIRFYYVTLELGSQAYPGYFQLCEGMLPMGQYFWTLVDPEKCQNEVKSNFLSILQHWLGHFLQGSAWGLQRAHEAQIFSEIQYMLANSGLMFLLKLYRSHIMKFSTIFYPNPVLALRYCRCLRLCLSVCVSITGLSGMITLDPFKLGSPNLDQMCKTTWLRFLLFCDVISFDLKVQT